MVTNQLQRPIRAIGSLSSDVFERRTSTGSEVFSLLTCLDDIKFVFLSFFTVIEAIWLKICAKPPSKFEKGHFRLTCVAQKRCCLSSLMYLRIVPRAWQNKVVLRVEVYDCSWSQHTRSERTSNKDHVPHVNSFWKWKDRQNCLNRGLKTSCNFIIFFRYGLPRFTVFEVVYTAAYRIAFGRHASARFPTKNRV